MNAKDPDTTLCVCVFKAALVTLCHCCNSYGGYLGQSPLIHFFPHFILNQMLLFCAKGWCQKKVDENTVLYVK